MVSIELLLVFYDQIAKNVMHFFLSASFLCSLLCLMENTYASVPKKKLLHETLLTTIQKIEFRFKSPWGEIVIIMNHSTFSALYGNC